MQEGIVATAMYDFQASGDDEISFDPGDTIINIDKVRNKMHFYNILCMHISPRVQATSNKMHCTVCVLSCGVHCLFTVVLQNKVIPEAVDCAVLSDVLS